MVLCKIRVLHLLEVFFDNIIWSSDSVYEFEAQLLNIVKWLYKYNLTIRLDKCNWYEKEIESFGYKLSKNKITPNVKSVENIVSLQVPQKTDDVKKLTGTIIWLNKFIPNLQEYLSPINKLTRKNIPFKWSNQCDVNLDIIKKLVEENPFLIPPNPNKPFRITVDGSGKGIGAVLEQQVKLSDIFPHYKFEESKPVLKSSHYTNEHLDEIEQKEYEDDILPSVKPILKTDKDPLNKKFYETIPISDEHFNKSKCTIIFNGKNDNVFKPRKSFYVKWVC